MESTCSVQNSVLDDVDDALFGDEGFGFDLYDGAADDGGVEEHLRSGFGHGF